MISAADSNLTRERIQQLLAAVGNKSSADTEQYPDAKDYNWRLSNYFGREHLKKIEKFANKAASNIASNFKKLYVSDFDISIASVTQHLGGEFIKPEDTAKNYYLAFAAKDQKIGVLAMPAQTANTWATQLLGDIKTDVSDERELSQLELSLLFDIASAAIKGLSDAFGAELTPVDEIAKNTLPFELDSIQDICKITLNVKKSNSDQTTQAGILFLSEKIAPIAGQAKTETVSAQNVSKALMNYLQQIPVSFTIRFADAKLNLQDLMSLQTDDTILLNKKISESADVILNDKVIFRARPAKSGDNYAVVLTESYNKK
ncbi:MAG: FliM/FliN family flagellar motor switch protein [Phycisphaerales bacterium]